MCRDVVKYGDGWHDVGVRSFFQRVGREICVTVVCERSVKETIVMVDLFVCGRQDGSAETAFGDM